MRFTIQQDKFIHKLQYLSNVVPTHNPMPILTNVLISADKEADVNVKPLITVHDEVNFSVKDAYLHQFMEKIKPIFEMRIPNWRVPLRIDISVGSSWGRCFDVTYDGGKFTPVGKLLSKES